MIVIDLFLERHSPGPSLVILIFCWNVSDVCLLQKFARTTKRVWWHLSDELCGWATYTTYKDPGTERLWASVEDYLHEGQGSWIWLAHPVSKGPFPFDADFFLEFRKFPPCSDSLGPTW